MRKLLLLSLTVVMLASGELWAQERTVSGRITSADDGSALPGVNVVIKGTTSGTASDGNGNYSLTVSGSDAVLSFSFIGLKSIEIPVGNNSTINVTMEADATSLEEVLVVGYSTSTSKSFTGSAKQVTSEAITRKSVSNISQGLAGEVAGVRIINTSGQPGTVATVRIRGFGSVNGNRDPLYVLDGVPFSGTLNAINPADIESTTVLKDAAATAIYGARGANGVIVINTKRGKRNDSYIEIDNRTGHNFDFLPRYQTIKNPEQYIGLVWESIYNRGVNTNQADPVAFANNRLFGATGVNAKYNMWNVANGGELIDPATGQVRAGVTRKYNPENWEDYAFQASSRSETNLRIGGGNQEVNYYTSFGYLKDVGYSINSDFERISARVNVNHHVKKWLSGGLNLGYALTETNNGGQSNDSGSVFWFVDNIPSIYPLFERDADGELRKDPYYGGNLYDYGEGRGFGALTNAIADANQSIRKAKRHDINLNASLDFEIYKGLTFENRFGVQYWNDGFDSQNNPFYGPSASQKGSIFKRKREALTYNLLNMLRYRTSFGTHNVEVLAAHEANSYEFKELSGSKFNLIDDNGVEWNNAVGSVPPGSFTNDNTLESFFGQVNYNYNDTYFVTATLRRDGSSRFYDDKWGTFGSVGLSWMLTNENFMKSQNIVNDMKLKASFGTIGDQAGLGLYPWADNWSIDPDPSGNPAFSFVSKGNRELGWETSEMWQVGTEFSIGKWVDASIEYYVKNTKALIFDRRVAPSLGYAIIQSNDGKLRNQGLEFDVTGHLLRKGTTFIDLGINGEFLKNKIIEMPIDPATGLQKVIDPQGLYGWSVGHSIFDFYTREYAGVNPETGRATWTVHYHDANEDGEYQASEKITNLTDYVSKNPDNAVSTSTTTTWADATLKYVGKSAIPKIRGGVNLRAGYKGIDLSVQLLYSFGGYAFDGTYQDLMGNPQAGGNNWHVDMLNRWKSEGDVTDVPVLVDNNLFANTNAASTRFLTKASYLNLNTVRLGYTFPTAVISKIGMRNLNVYVSGDNLWLKSERKGFNPMISETGASARYRYSPLSTLSAGATLKF
jgi:TonB-linked SusC/RagA family outer membrane protein